MTLTVETRSHDDTLALARRVGALLRSGDVVVLAGELGTGKTVFVKGVAVALGIAEQVVSPTFTIVRVYDAPVPLVHVDVYRVDRFQELHDIGLEELISDDVVTVVEWGDRIGPLLPADRLEVTIATGPGDDDRQVCLDATGPSWNARLGALRSAAGAA